MASIKAIADATGLPESKVKEVLRKGMRKLAESPVTLRVVQAKLLKEAREHGTRD